jgi:glycosyltransferase involved in cell wall biosynthesis
VKICLLNPIGQLGGAERALLDVIAELAAAQPAWRLSLIVGDEGPLVDAARTLGISALALPLSPDLARLGDWARSHKLSLVFNSLRALPAALSDLRRLRRVLAQAAPDIIHTNGFKMHLLAAAAATGDARVLWHVRDYVSPRPLMARLMRLAAPRCAAAIVNSRAIARDLRAVCGRKLRIHTVYDGIDLTRFAPCGPRLDLDSVAGLPPAAPNTLRIGLLATFARWKGQEIFLRALAALPSKIAFRGYIIGGAIYRTLGSQYSLAELAQMAGELGLAGKVGFTGFVPDSAPALRALDVVVHASTRPEPFGLAIAEAMACGKPIVASADAGACEVIAAGHDGMTTPPGDAQALAGHLLALATSDLRRAIGQAARVTAAREFSRARAAREVVEVYRQIRPDTRRGGAI